MTLSFDPRSGTLRYYSCHRDAANSHVLVNFVLERIQSSRARRTRISIKCV